MTITFTEFVQNKALEARLPFNIDFNLETLDTEVVETIGKLNFHIINDLTAGETFFLEIIEEYRASMANDFSVLVKRLSFALKNAMGLDTVEEAAKHILEPKKEWLEDNAYLQFTIDYQSESERLLNLYRTMDNDVAMNMLMVTFFIKSRVDADWTMGKTASLPNRQLAKIKDLIAREMNGGNTEQSETSSSDVDASEDTSGK